MLLRGFAATVLMGMRDGHYDGAQIPLPDL
jgi:hypothetical protein